MGTQESQLTKSTENNAVVLKSSVNVGEAIQDIGSTLFLGDLILTLLSFDLGHSPVYSHDVMSDTDDVTPSCHIWYNLWRLYNSDKKAKVKYATILFLASCQTAFSAVKTFFVLHPQIFHCISLAASSLFSILAAWFTCFRFVYLTADSLWKCSISGLISNRAKSLEQFKSIKVLTKKQEEERDLLSIQHKALIAMQKNNASSGERLLVTEMLQHQKNKRNALAMYAVFTAVTAIAVTVMIAFPPAAPCSLLLIGGVIAGTMLAIRIKDFWAKRFNNWLEKEARARLAAKNENIDDDRLKIYVLRRKKINISENDANSYWNGLPTEVKKDLCRGALFHIDDKDFREKNHAGLILNWWLYELTKPVSDDGKIKGCLTKVALIASTPLIFIALVFLGARDSIRSAINQKVPKDTKIALGNSDRLPVVQNACLSGPN